jgi:hypothetical protein
MLKALVNAVMAAAKARSVPVVLVLINAGQIATDNLAIQPDSVVEAFYPAFGVRCAFSDRNLHSRMLLVPTHARLNRVGV